MATKSTKFNLQWLDAALFPDFEGWLDSVKGNPLQGYCKVCRKTFELSNMGREAAKSHAKGTVHKKLIVAKSMCNQPTIESAFRACVEKDVHVSAVEENVKSPVESQVEVPTLKQQSAFFCTDEVTKSEVIWALTVVEKRLSLRSCVDISYIFKMMFPDSPTAQKFQLGKDKVSYIIHYGLSHYFHETLIEILKKCDNIVICFDESLNKVVQKGQMDLVVRFWDQYNDVVSTRYLCSVFLGSAKAKDLLDKFLEGLSGLPLQKLLQVSMDGPNVNLSFLNKLEEHMNVVDPNGKRLVQFGTCGLHVIHGAVKTGLQVVDWDITSILRNLYYLLKDSPVRRAQYTSITGSTVFPKKFCAIRWLENSACLERAIDIIEHVKKYLAEGKLKDSKVSVFLKKALNDPLLKCKLSFFKSLVLQCESFLRRFQSPKPLAPYLHEELTELLHSLMKRVIKKEKLTSVSLLKVDLSAKDNFLEPSKTDVGFGTKKMLSEVKVKEKEKFLFFSDCQKVLQNMLKKVIEKSPLKYKGTLALSSLNPSVIYHQPNSATTRFRCLLEILHKANRIDESLAEKSMRQYELFCSEVKQSLQDEFSAFEEKHEDGFRLDNFFSGMLKKKKAFEDLWQVIKIVLIFSHGNASVESGFSVNKGILMENMQEESVLKQRQVYDAIKNAGGVKNIEINKQMLLAVRASRQKYRNDLMKKQELQREERQLRQQKRKVETLVKELERKRKLLNIEKQKEDDEIQRKIDHLEHKRRNLKM